MISIITPTYNCANSLIKCLVVLENQTYKDFEAIIVDDGSTDNTQEILEQYIRLGTKFPVLSIKQKHKGANSARNEGFKHAKGDYILFLDADKELQSNALEKFLNILEQNPDKAYAYSNYKRDNIEHICIPFDESRLKSGELLIDTCSLLRKEYFTGSGFDPKLKRLQDWDLWLSILKKGGRGIFINEFLFTTYYRQGDITSTEDLAEADKYIRKKYKRFLVNGLKGLVDIIIVRFNTPGYDIRCFESIIKNTNYPFYQVTFFDNYTPRLNLGRLWNLLISKSLGEYIVLLNNDTEPQPDWLSKVVEIFEKEENVGAVGPSTNQCHTPQKVTAVPKDYTIVDFEKEYGKNLQLSAFCLFFPKKIWSEVGGFNESFGFYAQENEFLHRVQEKGYKTYWRKDAFVWHKGEASAKKLEKKEGFNIEEERRKGNEFYQKILKGEL